MNLLKFSAAFFVPEAMVEPAVAIPVRACAAKSDDAIYSMNISLGPHEWASELIQGILTFFAVG
jgi:hypothetical protein